ncbi:putative dynactin Arp1 p62 subunit RO2 [Aspergillus undulatus]|uniref:putative dynactin Arp1 p62 subunit RO2 n=1 Tax=Aspergillus undulatus TaxID=1810928 RepID=UPI003CCCA17C
MNSMACPFPYTFISCPCANTPVPDPSRKRRSRESPQKASPEKSRPEAPIDDEEDEQTFDPRAPRSNFSLYPPEQLLYCEDCHQIKCSRCITEEILCWYCPSCLFETPSSLVRHEGNRCGRNCFNCPSCTAPLAVTALEGESSGEHGGFWVLSCSYCMWTTLDIGIKFDKPTSIRAQLTKLTTDAASTAASRTRGSRAFSDLKSPLSMYSSIDEQLPPASASGPSEEQATNANPPRTRDARFAALKAFYKDQIAATTTTGVDPGDFAGQFSSPNTLQRIMSIYTQSRLSSLYGNTNRKSRARPPVMREALTPSEGLSIPNRDFETAIIRRLASDDCGWDGTASLEQRASQSPSARFVENLLPLPTLLRTKRSKRCKSCKHILVKPEFKPQSVRYRIRLIALSYIPHPTLRPLVLPPSSSSQPQSIPNLNALTPQKPVQLLLTLKNHMFDPIRITLATPSVTPGRVASKVTILCPQFDIGANKDAWSEALEPVSASPYERVAEAGKVWEKGRNWTTVVLEVVPGSLPGGGKLSSKPSTSPGGGNNDTDSDDDNGGSDSGSDSTPGGNLGLSGQLDWSGQGADPSQQIQPDEDVLEIPVFVRMEWDTDSPMEGDEGKDALGGAGLGGAGGGVKRELAYWMVFGVGRIVH